MLLAGRGFVLTLSEAKHLGFGVRRGLEQHIRPYVNGRELQHGWSGQHIIDLFGSDLETTRRNFPEIYQHLLATVKKERDAVAAKTPVRDAHEYAAKWWLFAKPRRDFRNAIDSLNRFIGTTETTKHRIFQFIPGNFVHDHMVIGFAFDDPYILGILSSVIHTKWALRAGGWLGVGNDPRYSKSRIFDPFPFPSCGELLIGQIRTVAEELDAFRKQRQSEHPAITLTQMYNELEKLRTNAKLDADEEHTKKDALILILRELHDKLDGLVFEAYGWPQTLADEEIMVRLVALNLERAAEERRGHVRWLRPIYQVPRFGKDLDKQAAKEAGAQITADLGLSAPAARKPSFPSDAVAQTAAVFAALASARDPTDARAIAACFRKTKSLERVIADVLSSLARLGHATTKDGKHFEIRRAA